MTAMDKALLFEVARAAAEQAVRDHVEAYNNAYDAECTVDYELAMQGDDEAIVVTAGSDHHEDTNDPNPHVYRIELAFKEAETPAAPA